MKRAGRPPADSDGPIAALYTIPQLAQMSGTTRFLMRRLLAAHGVRTLRSGRTVLVPLSEVDSRIPDLMEAIRVAARENSHFQRK
jgi:hypothetical protein